MLNILVKEAEERSKKNSENFHHKSQFIETDLIHGNINKGQEIDDISSKEKHRDDDNENGEDIKKRELEQFWQKNKHSGCTAKQGWFVYKGHAVVMTKVDVSSNNPWGMYNYYRMQVI